MRPREAGDLLIRTRMNCWSKNGVLAVNSVRVCHGPPRFLRGRYHRLRLLITNL